MSSARKWVSRKSLITRVAGARERSGFIFGIAASVPNARSCEGIEESCAAMRTSTSG